MIEFELTPQKSGAVAITGYRENGVYLGAVAVVKDDPERGRVIRVSEPVSLAGLQAILKRLGAESKKSRATREAARLTPKAAEKAEDDA